MAGLGRRSGPAAATSRRLRPQPPHRLRVVNNAEGRAGRRAPGRAGLANEHTDVGAGRMLSERDYWYQASSGLYKKGFEGNPVKRCRPLHAATRWTGRGSTAQRQHSGTGTGSSSLSPATAGMQHSVERQQVLMFVRNVLMYVIIYICCPPACSGLRLVRWMFRLLANC